MLRKVFGIFALSIILVACSDGSEVETIESDVATEQAEVKLKEEIKEELIAELEAKASEDEQRKLEQEFLESFRSIMDMAEIEFASDSKSYVLTPTNKLFILEMVYMLSGEADRQKWDEMVEAFVSLSNEMTDRLGEGYSLVMLNPSNKEKIFIAVMDGVVFYNEMDKVK